MNILRNNPTSRFRKRFGFDDNISTKPSKKLDHQRLDPLFIVKQINIVTFQLKLLGSMRIHPMFHVSLLEPYHVFTILKTIHDPLHLLKSMVNKNMKWKTFQIQGSLIVNSNILFIGMRILLSHNFGRSYFFQIKPFWNMQKHYLITFKKIFSRCITCPNRRSFDLCF